MNLHFNKRFSCLTLVKFNINILIKLSQVQDKLIFFNILIFQGVINISVNSTIKWINYQ